MASVVGLVVGGCSWLAPPFPAERTSIASAPTWELSLVSGPGETGPDSQEGPEPQDPYAFGARVRLWQASERLARLSGKVSVSDPQPVQGGAQPFAALDDADPRLAADLRTFRSGLRWRVVTRTLGFVQRASRLGYRRDLGGDAWPILHELLITGRDDCDGWELLTFSLLRESGFRPGELYRAILESAELPARYHMVTLWFERPIAAAVSPPARMLLRDDPWVLDATAEVARKPERLSRIQGWQAERIFDERNQFEVQAAGSARAPAR